MPNPAPTLIYNAFPNNIPLKILLQPSGATIPLPPGISLTFQLLAVDGGGNPTGGFSPLGMATMGDDGSSVTITPTATGQFGFAVLQTTANPTGRSQSVVATLFLLFVDEVDTIVYDTANITGGPIQH